MEGSKHRESMSARTPTALQHPFLVYLEAILPSLSPIERQIGEYILEDPERVLSSTVSDMHLGSGASIGSIVGFCRRFGFRGFTNLKISVARGLPQKPFSVGYPEGHEHALLSVADKVFQCHIQSLRDARLLNSEGTLQKVSEVLEGSRRIEFFSIGMSYPIAYAACGKLRLLGMSAATQSDSHLQVIAATQLQRGDVAFGISFSGRTRETVQCLQIAREGKVATVSVTNCMMSPITEYSDLVL
jgi:RpiR family transcriptional regulator, carbohydrate utilization regulator